MDDLLELERKTRMSGDVKKLLEVQMDILKNCNSDSEVVHILKSLVNKRNQDYDNIKKLIKCLFESNKSISFLKDLLSKVTEGNIFLEDERIYISTYIKETCGNNVYEAYQAVKGVPAETFTTISEAKRNTFLFEQFRLCLLLKDYEGSELIMKKVKKSYLTNDESIIFLNYCIILRIGQDSLLEACKLYLELNEKYECKKNVAMASLLCIMSSSLVEKRNVIKEKKDLLERLTEFKNNDEGIRLFTQKFVSDVIISKDTVYQIQEAAARYGEEINPNLIYKSIVEHNFNICTKFFSKISLSELAQVMEITEDSLVDFISSMVNSNLSTAKISQKDLFVDFGDKEFNSSVNAVLDRLVEVSYMIHRNEICKE